ncbi:hypothetical protein GF312_11540 [Candidatus Poribacteria bacterium]|nr:hypothetical protein [Candidatus Poribacteria bacterium]
MINVGIVGAGLIGTKRAKVISEDVNSQLVAVSDINIEKAKALEQYCKIKDNGCQYRVYQDWQKMLDDENIDVIIASTPNCLLAPVTIAAAESGKHVLSEKPLGRNPEEASKMVDASEKNNVLLRVGFNHRYHPAYRKLVEFYQKGEIGDIYFIRARYGHGARPGFEKEWRANPEIAGGGELLDQGVHIIDLARNLMGCFTEVFGFVSTFDWNINPLEDNGFALLKNSEGKVFSMHASWTQWNNLFSFEVYGSKGFLKMEGLGRSYGTETLRIGWRKPESGPPDEDLLVFNGTDQSFKLEWQDFIKSIITGSPNKVTGNDGLQAVRLVYAIYESSKTGRKVTGKW